MKTDWRHGGTFPKSRRTWSLPPHGISDPNVYRTQGDVMAWTDLQSNRSFARQPLTEENVLKGQKGHEGHPGGESIPCAACPGHGVWLPSVFLPKQVVVSGLRSQRHDLVSCQLSQLVCGGGNKTWDLPHPCPSSAPWLLMGTNYEGGSCSAAV